jgi:hypothetical protein
VTYRLVVVSDPIQGIDRCWIMEDDELVTAGDVSEYEDMKQTVAIMNLATKIWEEQDA